MAISLVSGARGTATNKTSNQSLALTPSGNLAAGNYGLLAVVLDNVDAASGATSNVSAADSLGRPWPKLYERSMATAGALDGVTCALFLCYLPYWLTTSQSVTATFTAASTAKGAGLAEFSCAAGYDIVLSASGSNGANAGASTSYSVALSGLTSVAGFYIGMAAAE